MLTKQVLFSKYRKDTLLAHSKSERNLKIVNKTMKTFFRILCLYFCGIFRQVAILFGQVIKKLICSTGQAEKLLTVEPWY